MTGLSIYFNHTVHILTSWFYYRNQDRAGQHLWGQLATVDHIIMETGLYSVVCNNNQQVCELSSRG